MCDVGEDWLTSANRELLEEAGVSGTLADCGPVSFEADDVALIGRIYVCCHEGPFVFNDGEVTATQWIPLAELDAFVAANDVPPDSAQIVNTNAISSGIDQLAAVMPNRHIRTSVSADQRTRKHRGAS